MKDTTDEINDLQLKIWLSKTPSERLFQQLIDNEALYVFWNNIKPVVKEEKASIK